MREILGYKNQTVIRYEYFKGCNNIFIRETVKKISIFISLYFTLS